MVTLTIDMRIRPLRLFLTLALVLASRVTLPLPLAAQETTALPRSTPEAQGIASSAILGFVRAADTTIDAMNSVMIVRHGHVVAEGWWAPYDSRTPHMLYSLSKSFTSTAVGLAAAEGKLSLDDLVLSYFPGEAPAVPSENLRRMRVRDLLRMNTGQESEPSMFGPGDSTQRHASWVRRFLAHPVPFKPGTHFLYNSPATYMLSAIVQKTTGETVLDYLTPRLFAPLGIERPTWMASPQGISVGAFGLNVRTEDIAKLGQLSLSRRKDELSRRPWIHGSTRTLSVSTRRLTKEPDVFAAELRCARVPHCVGNRFGTRRTGEQTATSLLQPQPLLVLDRAHRRDRLEVLM